MRPNGYVSKLLSLWSALFRLGRGPATTVPLLGGVRGGSGQHQKKLQKLCNLAAGNFQKAGTANFWHGRRGRHFGHSRVRPKEFRWPGLNSSFDRDDRQKTKKQ